MREKQIEMVINMDSSSWAMIETKMDTTAVVPDDEVCNA